MEPPAYRRVAANAMLLFALLVAVGVWVQVYLIGAYIFGAGADALDAHEGAGYAVHGFELLVVIAALVARPSGREVGMSVALAALGTLQITLAQADKWAGALHPLFALVVLTLAVMLVQSGMARRRAMTARAAA